MVKNLLMLRTVPSKVLPFSDAPPPPPALLGASMANLPCLEKVMKGPVCSPVVEVTKDNFDERIRHFSAASRRRGSFADHRFPSTIGLVYTCRFLSHS
jgi:hypothetical protein